jgi:hypothetical protein
MKEFWNERYGQKEYAYGTEANDFLKSFKFHEPKKILCLAEGEGRNAVYLASQGHDVTCVDYAEMGLKKAKELATEHDVTLNLICEDLNHFDFGSEKWDVIVSIFGHFPPELRQNVHQKFFSALKINGEFILEAYTKDQLLFKTGGPQSEEMLYSENMLKKDFELFSSLKLTMLHRTIAEGLYHNGNSAVIQAYGVKK